MPPIVKRDSIDTLGSADDVEGLVIRADAPIGRVQTLAHRAQMRVAGLHPRHVG
jgi:hypothetical protein